MMITVIRYFSRIDGTDKYQEYTNTYVGKDGRKNALLEYADICRTIKIHDEHPENRLLEIAEVFDPRIDEDGHITGLPKTNGFHYLENSKYKTLKEGK